MRTVSGLVALLGLLVLGGCEANPFEAWAYNSTLRGGPAQGEARPPPASASPAAAAASTATVTSAPLRSITVP